MVTEAERRKEQGIRQVSMRNREWIASMRACAGQIAVERGFVCTDDLRDHAAELYRNGVVPNHPNAWGGIFRHPSFICIGYVRSRYPGNHARRIGLWRLA